jgi:phosphoglycerate kinase
MTIKIRTLDDLALSPGARVFYRVDYNVPLDGERITDATRIEETLPTLRILRDAGARIVVGSHLGRPKGQRKEKYSLAPVRAKLAELLGANVQWAADCVGIEPQEKADALKNGEVLLVENLRFHPGEEANDDGFALELRKLANFYVMRCRGSSIAKTPSAACCWRKRSSSCRESPTPPTGRSSRSSAARKSPARSSRSKRW